MLSWLLMILGLSELFCLFLDWGWYSWTLLMVGFRVLVVFRIEVLGKGL